jgi:acyl-CoA thioester hydrolase
MSAEFDLPLAVRPEDIDQLGHVNNIVYLRWIQDVATAHWIAVAPDYWQAASLWIVLRHEIDYLKSARLGDALVAHTRVGDARGAKFVRLVEIRRGDDLLASAKTTWVMVDAKSLRPMRVPADIISAFA